VIEESKVFVRVLVDCTTPGSDDLKASAASKLLMNRYRVTGWPHVVLLGPDGDVIDRISGLRPPAEVRRTLDAVLRTVEIRRRLAELRKMARSGDEASRGRARAELVALRRDIDGALRESEADVAKQRGRVESVRVARHETVRAGRWRVEFGCASDTFLAFRIVGGPAPRRVVVRLADGTEREATTPRSASAWRSLDLTGVGPAVELRLEDASR